MPVQWSLNTLFDGLPRPTLGAFGREVPTFRTCGIAGFYLSVLVLVSGGLTGRSVGVLALIAVIFCRSMLGETENQFSLTRAALRTGGRAHTAIPISCGHCL